MRFRWLLLSGPGGIGKSRLALELVLAQASGWWNAGFVDPGQKLNWSLWQPRLPTLMIIDYAARDSKPVAALLKGLAERETPHLLRYPVRVVLIERSSTGPWFDEILGTSRMLAGDAVRAANIELAPIADPWPIFETILGPDRAALSSRSEVIGMLKRIDPQSRPLFAFLMADAMRHDRDFRHWDRTALLTDVIDRERRSFWLPAAQQAGIGGQIIDILMEERALALATMARTSAYGFSPSEFAKLGNETFPAWNPDRHPLLFFAMTGRDSSAGVFPLEPDILGEHFVLDLLQRLDPNTARRVVGAAWKSDPQRTADFVWRCHDDAPGHSGLPIARLCPPSDYNYPWQESALPSWADLLSGLIEEFATRDQVVAVTIYDELFATIEKLEGASPGQFGRIWALSIRSALNLQEHLSEDQLAKIVDVANKHPTECCHLYGLLEEGVPKLVGDRLRNAFNVALVEFGALGKQVDEDEEVYREELWREAVVALINSTSKKSQQRAAMIFEYALTFCDDEERLYEEFRDEIASLYTYFGMASFDLLRKSNSRGREHWLADIIENHYEDWDDFDLDARRAAAELASGDLAHLDMLRNYEAGIDDVLDETWAETAGEKCYRHFGDAAEVERLLDGILKVDKIWRRTDALRYWAEAVGGLANRPVGAGNRYGWDDRIERMLEKEQWLKRLMDMADRESAQRRDMLLSEWKEADEVSDNSDDQIDYRTERALREVFRGGAVDVTDHALLELWAQAAALRSLSLDPTKLERVHLKWKRSLSW